MKTSFALAAIAGKSYPTSAPCQTLNLQASALLTPGPAITGVQAAANHTTIVCSGCPPSSSVEDIVTREPIPDVNCSAPTLSVITSTKTGGESMPTHPGMPSQPGVPTGTGGMPMPTGGPSPSEVPVAGAGKMAGSVGAVAVAMAALML